MLTSTKVQVLTQQHFCTSNASELSTCGGLEHCEQTLVARLGNQDLELLHTSAYVSIRQHTSAYVSMRQRLGNQELKLMDSRCVNIRAFVPVKQVKQVN